MRKRLVTPIPQDVPPLDEGWLDLDDAAVVEVTSEEKEYPVESALVSGEMRGWRAADSGTQTVRLIFDEPQRFTRIALAFEETETERTQEFVLRWSGDGGRSFREVVRQQWDFSPPNTSREVEEYQFDLSGVAVLELIIVPDISRGSAPAPLKRLGLRCLWRVKVAGCSSPRTQGSNNPPESLIRSEGTMLPRTVFLSRLIGLYCILVALSMITRKQATLESVTAVLRDPSMMFVLGAITLIAGLAMVLAASSPLSSPPDSAAPGSSGSHNEPEFARSRVTEKPAFIPETLCSVCLSHRMAQRRDCIPSMGRC